MTDLPAAAVTAAAKAIVSRHLAAAHWANCDSDAHRAALMIDAMADATSALEAAAPHITAAATAAERARACQIAASYLDGSVLREFADEVGGW